MITSTISSQGPEVTATRSVSTKIPITQIPNVMRALGFYPSEQEVYTLQVLYTQYMKICFYFMNGDTLI